MSLHHPQTPVWQAITSILEAAGDRAELCQALLKCAVLAALTNIITLPAPLVLCCAATKAASSLCAWYQVSQNRYGMDLFRFNTASLTTFLLTALSHPTSAISTELDLRRVPTWKHGCTISVDLDDAVGCAIDSFGDLYALCPSDLQQEVMLVISRVVEAGMLAWRQSLNSAIFFLNRHFSFGLTLLDEVISVKQINRAEQPTPPKQTSPAATTAMSSAWIQCLAWRYSDCSFLDWRECMEIAEALRSCLMGSHSLWTPDNVGHMIAELSKVMTNKTHDDELCELQLRASQCLAWIITPHSSRPWDLTLREWGSTKECELFESMVTLEALKAGALEVAVGTMQLCPSLSKIQRHTPAIVKQLLGLSPRGLRSITHIHSSGLWPCVVFHLAEAAHAMTKVVLSDSIGRNGLDYSAGELAATETKAVDEGDEDDMRVAASLKFWGCFSLLDVCKIMAQLSALHQQEPTASTSSPLDIVEMHALSPAHDLQHALQPVIQTVIAHISEIVRDGKLSSALTAAPLMAGLLGHDLPEQDFLHVNTDLLFESKAIAKVCGHLLSFKVSIAHHDFKQLLAVPLLLARRSTGARAKLASMGLLPAMLKIAGSGVAQAEDAMTFLCNVAREGSVSQRLRELGADDVMEHILEVRHVHILRAAFAWIRVDHVYIGMHGYIYCVKVYDVIYCYICTVLAYARGAVITCI